MEISEKAVELLQNNPELIERIIQAVQDGGTCLNFGGLDLSTEDLALLRPMLVRMLPKLKEIKLLDKNSTDLIVEKEICNAIKSNEKGISPLNKNKLLDYINETNNYKRATNTNIIKNTMVTPINTNLGSVLNKKNLASTSSEQKNNRLTFK